MILALTGIASAGDLPTAAEILDRHVWSVGGERALSRQHDRVMAYVLKIPALGADVKVTDYAKEPRFVFRKFEVQGREEDGGGYTWTEGCDGEVCWEVRPPMGPRAKKGPERFFEMRRAFFHQPLRWREIYPEAEMLGRERYDEYDCFKLKLFPEKGEPIFWFVEEETYLVRGVEATLPTSIGPVRVEAVLEDYREIGGVLYPFKIHQQVANPPGSKPREMVIEIDDIRQNAGLPDSRFEAPKTLPDKLSD
jgi:hypothetical protein